MEDPLLDLGRGEELNGAGSAYEAGRIEGRGAVSVALEVGDELFVGSFVGDQIMRVPRPD